MEKSDKSLLTGLDVLRFLLAVVILIYHFPHFDNIHFSNVDVQIDRSFSDEDDPVLMMNLPFKSALSLIYKYGDFAVRVFWMISGIIFYTIYLEAIHEKKISFFTFLFLRFSKLYPLHIITLCLVAVLQAIYLQKFGDYFIYKNNDALHFLLNLLLINYWNARFGFSFNGPFWSVSIELFIYIIFYMYSSVMALTVNKTLLFLSLLFFIFFYIGILSPFSEGLMYFFSGCLLVNSSKKPKVMPVRIAMALLMLVIFLKWNGNYSEQSDLARLSVIYMQVSIAAFVIIVFMFLFKKVNERFQRIFRHVGNMTYAVYMVHISAQLILILLFYERGRTFFMNTTFFFTYIVVCCMLGHLAFAYIEGPVQNFLRKRLKHSVMS